MVRTYYIKDSIAIAFQRKYPNKASSMIQKYMEKMLAEEQTEDSVEKLQIELFEAEKAKQKAEEEFRFKQLKLEELEISNKIKQDKQNEELLERQRQLVKARKQMMRNQKYGTRV